jgi:hypothetical protein
MECLVVSFQLLQATKCGACAFRSMASEHGLSCLIEMHGTDGCFLGWMCDHDWVQRRSHVEGGMMAPVGVCWCSFVHLAVDMLRGHQIFKARLVHECSRMFV